MIAAYSLTSAIPSGGGGGSTPSGPTFLGSVRIVGSAPAGTPVVRFLGTLTVVGSAPAGVPNPYLGSVVLGTPVAGGSNPSLGEVVVVTDVPAGDTDIFLGAIEDIYTSP